MRPRMPSFRDTLRRLIWRPLAIVQAQADGAADHGIAATPTLQMRDERTGQSLWLQGPIPGDSLLSAMDLLVTDDPASELAETTELSAVPDGNKRSEEHTSELQSLMRISYAVFCLKKKTHNTTHKILIPHLQHKYNKL